MLKEAKALFNRPLADMQELFTRRSLCMALAILWVVYFHIPLEFAARPLPLTLLSVGKWWGYGGVDIFLFVSGLGCYFSLQRDGDIPAFLQRRFRRTMPMWWSFLPFYLLFVLFTGELSLSGLLGNVFCLSYLAGTGNMFNWYLTGMWLCYLLAPILVPLVKRQGGRLWGYARILLCLLAISLCWLEKDSLIMWSRLPIFCLGICVADYSEHKKSLCLGQLLGVFACMLLGLGCLAVAQLRFTAYLWSYGLYWYPFLLITPGLCLCSCLLAEGLQRLSLGRRLLHRAELLGENTFPLYLVHILLIKLYSAAIKAEILAGGNFWAALLLLLMLPGTLLFIRWYRGLSRLGRTLLWKRKP